MTGERLEHMPAERVEQLDDGRVRGHQDRFPVRTELEAGPLNLLTVCCNEYSAH